MIARLVYRMRLFDRLGPVAQMIVATLGFGALTFVVFWCTVKWNLLPVELSSGQLSQENTGLFDALGGWALGFAGALVAIRIAGLANNIQQSDSIREQIKIWDDQVRHISDLNSRLTRAAYDAKRACAAVLLHANELDSTKRLPEYLRNSINSGYKKRSDDVRISTPEGALNREESLQTTLEQKLEVLVEVIEEALKDSVFRTVLEDTTHTSNSENAPTVRDYFWKEETRNQVLSVIEKNDEFVNVLQELNDGARNFGVGLMELRAKNLFDYFYDDLMRITELQKNDLPTNGQNIEIADAAWIFLGLLLLRSKGEPNTANNSKSENHGFIFLALLLGSLPTDKTIEAYLKTKAQDTDKIYSSKGSEDLQKEISQLSKRLYFVDASELKEIARLIRVCNDNLYYLTVSAKTTGISSNVEDDLDDGLKDKSGERRAGELNDNNAVGPKNEAKAQSSSSAKEKESYDE